MGTIVQCYVSRFVPLIVSQQSVESPSQVARRSYVTASSHRRCTNCLIREAVGHAAVPCYGHARKSARLFKARLCVRGFQGWVSGF